MTIIKGDAYILRTCCADMTSHGGFVWQREGMVEASDWKPTAECGNGLHGFLWGEGAGGLADWSDDAVWIVARVSEWIDLGGKVKFPSAEVVFAGARHEATQEIVRLGARGAVLGGTATAGNYGIATAGFRGTATAGDDGTATAGDDGTATAGDDGTATAGDDGTATAGYRGTATAGDYGTATAGDYGTATAGDYGIATAGFRGTATAGDYGTATAGDDGTATAGDGGTATAGDDGTATAGDYGTAAAGDDGTATAGDGGILQIHYFAERWRVSTAYVGKNGIKPNVAYRLNKSAEFVEAAQ